MTAINVPWRSGRGAAYEQALIDEIESLRSLIVLVTEGIDTEDPGWFLSMRRTYSISTDDLEVIQRALGSGREVQS